MKTHIEPYKQRMIEEYHQLAGRLDKLKSLLERWQVGALEFTPTCPRELLEEQQSAMQAYKSVLERRAAVEEIDLSTGGA